MEENVLNREVEAVEEAEETFEEIEEVAEDGDDEFEYDENGNIIVPDVEFESEDEEEDTETEEETPEEEKTEEEVDEEKADGESEEVTAQKEKEADNSVEEVITEPDPRDAEIERLQKRLNAIEAQGKDTLKKLGKENIDIIDGLIEVAAEAVGAKPEEYKAEIDKKAKDDAARKALQDQIYEIKATSDLKALHSMYPETQKYSHLKEMPVQVAKRFCELRDMGLSVKEAYSAANPDGVRTDTATAVKKQAQHASKEHLKSSVPKPSKSDGVSMTKAELAYWRDIFPDKSDAEIVKIYKKSI